MNIVGKLLEEHNMSQKELALTLGIAQPSVSAWVNQKADPKGQNAKRIAEIFGVDRDSIVISQPMQTSIPVPVQPAPSGLTDEDIAKIASLVQPNADAPRTIEARIVSFGMDKLPKEDRERLLAMIRALYSNRPELFNDKKGDTDETRF